VTQDADSVRAAFRQLHTMPTRPYRRTGPGVETWTAVQIQQALTVKAEDRAAWGDESLIRWVTAAVRENAEATGAVVLDQDPKCTWMALRDDMAPDYVGLVRDPKWWLLTVAQRVAVPEGHPVLSLDEEAP
jgi:hypothetical protein